LSLSLANQHASLPVAYRLYLPEDWATDRKRRRKTGVPKEVVFKTKPEIALEQIEAACKAGLPRGVVLMDAGMAAIPTCAPGSAHWDWPMWLVSFQTPRCGRATRDCDRRKKWSA
jgi:hypothetical protein